MGYNIGTNFTSHFKQEEERKREPFLKYPLHPHAHSNSLMLNAGRLRRASRTEERSSSAAAAKHYVM
jgi:hypothetical protein